MIALENLPFERLFKMGMEIQVNLEHKEKYVVENQSHMGSMLSQLESTNLNHKNILMNFQSKIHITRSSCQQQRITKIDMRKFDGNDFITWIF